MLGDDRIEKYDEGETNSVLLHVGDTIDPYEVKFPNAPDEWFYPSTNTANGDPTFDKVYNPGGWSSFYYLPIFSSGVQGG